MDRGLGELDEDDRMTRGGGGRKRLGGSQGDGGQAQDKRRAGDIDPSAEPRGRVEVNSEGGAQEVPHSESSRGGQERIHMEGVREGLHYGGGAPRLVAEELGGGQRPDFSSLQESVGPGDGVGHDRPGTGVHPLQRGERTEHHQRVRTWEACGEAIEHSEHDPGETGGGATELRGGESRSGNSAGITRASPTPSVSLENPSNSELWELPEEVEILLRNPQWVIREIDRCAYGRREKKPRQEWCRHTISRKDLVETTGRLAHADGQEEVLVVGEEVWKEWTGQEVEGTEWRKGAKDEWEAKERAVVRGQWLRSVDRDCVYGRG